MSVASSQYSVALPAAASPRATNSAAGKTLHTIERRLRESSYYYLRTISAAYEAGVVTLTGRVPTFYLKQTVQSLVEKTEGVERVVNLVDVVNPAGSP